MREERSMTTPSVDEDIERLREVIREAHAATKDARIARRELQETMRGARGMFHLLYEEHASSAIQQGLEQYEGVLADSIKKAETAVFKRFDDLADELLGESSRYKRLGKPSLKDQFQRIEKITEQSA